MTATVEQVMAELEKYDPMDPVNIDFTTEHSNRSPGIYVRIALTAGGRDVLTMERDTRKAGL